MSNRAKPTDPLKVEASEFGFLRVFALDRDEIVTRHGVANLIGALADPDKVEVVDTKDVEALGLTRYLIEGYGIEEDDIADEVDALDAIDGHVALIPTSAFNGQEATLEPSPPLRFIGLYAEAESAPPAPNMSSQSAEAATSPVDEQEESSKSGFGMRDLRLAVVTIVLLAAAYYAYTSL